MVTTRIIDSEPALVLQSDKKNLVVSDLHIGFEHKFPSNKISLGKNSSVNDIISNITRFFLSPSRINAGSESIILVVTIKIIRLP